MNIPPKTRYAGYEAIHHSRQVVGQDPAGMPAAVSGPALPVDLPWMDPEIAPCLRKLAPFGRFVFNDHQGADLSSPGQRSAVTAHGGPVSRGVDLVLDTVEEFVTGMRPVPSPAHTRFPGP